MTKDAIEAAEKFERWSKQSGGWTLDGIANRVLEHDDISASLTDAILATIELACAYLSAQGEDGSLPKTAGPQVQDGAPKAVNHTPLITQLIEALKEAQEQIECSPWSMNGDNVLSTIRVAIDKAEGR